MLECSGVSHSYEGYEAVLSDINLNLGKGQFIGLIGENGSGKSTLLKILAGLLKPSYGTVTLEGNRIKWPDEVHIPGHPQIKLVTQDAKVNLYASVRDNLREQFVKRTEEFENARTQRLLSLVGLSNRAEDKVSALSGGQRQKIALARALAEPTTVLLLDEPFSQVDTPTALNLITHLKELQRHEDILIIYVSHDPSLLLKFANELIVVEDGKVIQEGKTQEVHYNPVNDRTAALTGMFTKLDSQFYRPENLKITSDTDWTVVNSYPELGQFLIHMEKENSYGFAYSQRSLSPGEKVGLGIKTI